MDGGRRLLKSVAIKISALRARHAMAEEQAREPIVPTLTVNLDPACSSATVHWQRMVAGERILPGWFGPATSAALIAVAVFLGLKLGGQYEGFVARNGGPLDVLARTAGFSVTQVSVAGNKELTAQEVIAATGIQASSSLPFLDVAQLQERLKRLPLIADVSVRKFYPDKLVINIVEREPFALWQKDGNVHLVSVDGTVIDEMRDDRFRRLPHVVGAGANLRVREYVELLEKAPGLRDRIRAATLVSERRWTLKFANGVDVKLPEMDPASAIQALAKLDEDANVLNKDIIMVDLRVPGRAAFRLTETAAQARAEIMDKKTVRKGKA